MLTPKDFAAALKLCRTRAYQKAEHFREAMPPIAKAIRRANPSLDPYQLSVQLAWLMDTFAKLFAYSPDAARKELEEMLS